ncbi:hypothetical protein BS78_04G005500 [Paspalum vaginatum]|nr:hypothetical protein BS78_04G005500 [Paspalum vaginatum]
MTPALRFVFLFLFLYLWRKQKLPLTSRSMFLPPDSDPLQCQAARRASAVLSSAQIEWPPASTILPLGLQVWAFGPTSTETDERTGGSRRPEGSRRQLWPAACSWSSAMALARLSRLRPVLPCPLSSHSSVCVLYSLHAQQGSAPLPLPSRMLQAARMRLPFRLVIRQSCTSLWRRTPTP